MSVKSSFDLMAESRWTRRVDRLGFLPVGLFCLGAALAEVGDIARAADPVLADNLGAIGFILAFIAVPLFFLWGAFDLAFRVLRWVASRPSGAATGRATDRMATARWEVDLGFGPIRLVEMDPPKVLLGYPRSFRVDGTEHSFGMSLRPTQVTEFAIGGHQAKLTMRLVRPNQRIALRRAVLDFFRWNYGELIWRVYELGVDGRSRGTWVATTVDRVLRDWTYVEPGGALPTRDTEEWAGRALF